MSFAIAAKDLCTLSIGIGYFGNGPGDLIIECRPAAMPVEFTIGIIQRRIATLADVCSFLSIIEQVAGAGVFGGFVYNYGAFFGCKFIPFGRVGDHIAANAAAIVCRRNGRGFFLSAGCKYNEHAAEETVGYFHLCNLLRYTNMGGCVDVKVSAAPLIIT